MSQNRVKNITLGIIVDTALNIPPKTGVTYRLYYLSKKCAEKGVKVKIFLCNRNFENDQKIKILVQVRFLEFHIIPEKIFYNVKELNKIIKLNSLDILQVEDPVSALRYKKISENLNIPLCMEMHDVEFSLLKLLKDSPVEINLRKTISYFACKSVEKVICMTPLDYNELISEIGVTKDKLVLIPNPIDLKEFSYSGPNLIAKNIIFIGNMFYYPNQNALKFIAKKIYPSINKKIKPVKFTLIGMVPSEIKRRFSKDNFIFADKVDDLNEFLKDATIALCPVTEGSGMKVKLLNYCAAGLPIITTKIGSSGYEKIKSLIIENDINKYPTIITDLLTHPKEIRSIGKKNREGVEKYYDLDKITDKIIQVYQNILNQFHYKNKKVGEEKRLKLPLPLWLKEKRVKKIRNKNYYIIRNGKIIFKKEFSQIS